MDDALKRDVRIFPDLSSLSRAAAEESMQCAVARANAAGRCTIVLSGGHTPRAMYQLWAEDYRERIPWTKMHLFWGDERYVSPGDPHSNYRMVREALLEHVPIPLQNVYPMPTQFRDPDEAARAYEATLRAAFPGEWPEFDLVFLGMGPEGHTASLFPRSPALDVKDRWVVAVRAPAEPPLRLTLTLPALNGAQNVMFLVCGEEKRDSLHRAWEAAAQGSPECPVSMVRPAGRVTWFVDRTAAGSS
jgi:6-phosphogluconolactonase